METGNPRQVAILAMAAVGAVGFLVTRVGKRPVPPPIAAATAARRVAAVPAAAPLVLLKDPFSHARLAPVEPKAIQAPVEATPAKPLPPLPGALPAVGPVDVQGTLPEVRKAAPEKEARAAPKSEPTTTTIGLEAIATASDTVAFLTVGGAESQPFRPGQKIVGAIRLVRAEDGAVVLSGPKGRVTLDVGERVAL